MKLGVVYSKLQIDFLISDLNSCGSILVDLEHSVVCGARLKVAPTDEKNDSLNHRDIKKNVTGAYRYLFNGASFLELSQR